MARALTAEDERAREHLASLARRRLWQAENEQKRLAGSAGERQGLEEAWEPVRRWQQERGLSDDE